MCNVLAQFAGFCGAGLSLRGFVPAKTKPRRLKPASLFIRNSYDTLWFIKD